MFQISRRAVITGLSLSAFSRHVAFSQGTPTVSREPKGKLTEAVIVTDALQIIDARVIGEWAVAEVINTTDEWVSCAPMVLSFMDDQENILGSTDFHSMTKAIEPNGYTMLWGTFGAELFTDDEWKVMTATKCNSDTEEEDLATAIDAHPDIVEIEWSDPDTFGFVEVQGTIRNNSETESHALTAYIVVRDADERVVGYWGEYIKTEIGPGKTARFATELHRSNTLWGLGFDFVTDQNFSVEGVAGIPELPLSYSC